jgi:tetratricopeptide (TPR) repeat protein
MPGRREHQSVKALRAAGFAALLIGGATLAAANPVDALQRQGEAALQRGESQQALDAFERAAMLRHSAPIEIGIVRSLMQMGAYRRALGFAGHTAFAHPESHDGAALYTLLLRLGGQAPVAQRLVEAGLQRAPDDVALARARAVLAAPLADERVQALTALAPSGDSVPTDATVIGNATLLPDGRQALVPLQQLPADGALWVRNGLGRTVRAERHRVDAQAGVAVLRLAEAMDAPQGTLRRPFPGTPAFVVAFDRASTWPQLHSGFLGNVAGDGAGQWLGVDADAHSAGAAVFDGSGRLLGMALPASGDGRLRFIGLAAAAPLLPVAQPVEATPSAARAIDELYEHGLRSALQLIAAR